ncbi:MAG TPA: bifunctional nicotinamidase/pyrazinamidase [Candidatus Ozemobacteraceae bacterium]|nr:bifunctional nicotinamidase/pyrazinamidase [Candidatus Ozemobacteraceae bacterium]
MEALILVDLQNDFMPGGALAVREGDLVVPVANRLMPHFKLVIATQDWHPQDHRSFAASHPGKQPGDVIDLHGLSQVLWPVHCVAGTPGAALYRTLDQKRITETIRKGMNREIDSYSGFFDNGHRQATGLEQRLARDGVKAVTILGLATDYCVKFTALDAVRLGFKTRLVQDGCRGVELKPGDVEHALDEMRQAGVSLCLADDLLRP